MAKQDSSKVDPRNGKISVTQARYPFGAPVGGTTHFIGEVIRGPVLDFTGMAPVNEPLKRKPRKKRK